MSLAKVSHLTTTLAAGIYIGERIHSWLVNARNASTQRRLKELRDLEEATREEISVTFDLWWSGAPSEAARDKALERLPLSDEQRESLPEEVIDGMVTTFVYNAREQALNVATQNRLQKAEQALIETLPRADGIQEDYLRRRKERLATLEDIKNALIKVGVDVEALEREFAAAT